MREGAHRRRARARPVADAPVGALVADADELARDWMLALLADAPLESAGAVPVGDLVRQAPELCAAMARALADDAELDRLESGDLAPLAAGAGRLAGATTPAAAAGAVEMLRAVLWSGALAELRRPDPRLVADLADRLAAVAAAVIATALAAAPAAAAPPGAAPPAPAPVPAASAPPPAAPPRPAFWTAGDAARAVEAAVVDGTEADARHPRPRIADGDPRQQLEAAVEAHLVDRRTLAVLLVEIDGVERLLAAQLDDDATAAIARAEGAIEELLRPGDSARREGAGRIWIVLPGIGPAGGRALALRVGAAVGREAELRGVPLTASVGVAVFPVDAVDAPTLAEHAEEALFAARASGR